MNTLPYVVISCLPEKEQIELKKWLIGQTLPTVKDALGNIVMVCYVHDYEFFKQQKKEVRNDK